MFSESPVIAFDIHNAHQPIIVKEQPPKHGWLRGFLDLSICDGIDLKPADGDSYDQSTAD